LLYQVKAVKDGRRLDFKVFDDHLEWWPEGRTGVRFWLTPIKDQLALAPLVAQARAAGAETMLLTQIHSYEWFQSGQISIVASDGAAFYFHVIPARRARDVVTVLHPAWVPAKAWQVARDEQLATESRALAEADSKRRADEIAQAVAAALAARDAAPPAVDTRPEGAFRAVEVLSQDD
jgi:hypothetical protein